MNTKAPFRPSCTDFAWRENCNKRFCTADGGIRCPDFSRDISIRTTGAKNAGSTYTKEQSLT